MYSFELNGLLNFGLPIWIVMRVFTIIKKRKIGIDINIVDEIFTNLFVIYLFVLIGITILPIYVGGMPYLEELSFIERCRINLVPFIHYFKNGIFSISIIRNIVGNLLLLLPFILYLCVKYEKMRNLKSSATMALMISLSIELTQLVTNVLCISYGRAVDVEDLILNTTGVKMLLFFISNLLSYIKNSPFRSLYLNPDFPCPLFFEDSFSLLIQHFTLA